MIAKSKQQGFSLMELMIVVAIVGILAGIAYPSYQDSIRKTRRADAMTILSATNLAQERFFAVNGRYAVTLSSVGMTSSGGIFYSDAKYYAITVAGTATTYTLTATPVAGTSQAYDASCTTFTMNQLGAQGATGSDTSDCWKK